MNDSPEWMRLSKSFIWKSRRFRKACLIIISILLAVRLRAIQHDIKNGKVAFCRATLLEKKQAVPKQLL